MKILVTRELRFNRPSDRARLVGDELSTAMAAEAGAGRVAGAAGVARHAQHQSLLDLLLALCGHQVGGEGEHEGGADRAPEDDGTGEQPEEGDAEAWACWGARPSGTAPAANRA